MTTRLTPMIHVPDVQATARWYESIGFNLEVVNEEAGEWNFAMLSLGESAVMFNAGGRITGADRREVDLYVHTSSVAEMYERLKDRVEVQEGLHDSFYGMQEFIIRDLNGFWITFGQPLEGAEAR